MNIVLSICMNYSFNIFERFVGSLFDVCINTDLVLFISSNDITHCKKLQKKYSSLIFIVVDNKNIHIVNFRFKLYYDYLLDKLHNSHLYDYIFICDSRDVLFQKNIFTHPILNNNHDLYIFKEESLDITIDKCKFNTLYINKSGLNIHESVKNKSILCVGTILGNNKGILSYLKIFNKILLNNISEQNKSYYGTDSGINYAIIYSNLLENINIYFCENKDLLVYTIAFPIFLNLINYDELLNENNQIMYEKNVCYCVHQYDRLNNIIKKKMSIRYNYIE